MKTMLQIERQHIKQVLTRLSLIGSLFTMNALAADVSFSASFTVPTCGVSAPASVDFSDIDARAIQNGESIANPLPLTITLSGCSGWLAAGEKPGIVVSGSGTSDSGTFLFRLPATSEAVNYGFLLTTAADGNTLAEGAFVPTSGPAGSLPTENTAIALNAALSCGTQCGDASTRGGRLNAAVTFAFAYE